MANKKADMKDIREFCKLNNIKIPVEKHFHYYLCLLRRTYEYKNIDQTIATFEQLESTCSVHAYKENTFKFIFNYLKNSKAYEQFSNIILSPIDKPISADSVLPYYISVDMSQANWSVLKLFDRYYELSSSWTDLCRDKFIHAALAESKSFRQYVFGHLNPKRSTTIQQNIMSLLASVLAANGYIFKLSPDEIRIKWTPPVQETVQNVFKIVSDFKKEYCGLSLDSLKFKIQVRFDKSIEKDIFLRTVYGGEELQPLYKTLVGVPGQSFYMYFKTFILEEPIEERDTFFVIDGRLAKWVDYPCIT